MQNLARLCECGDRNIIKHIQSGAEKFQKYVTPILKARDEQNYTITTNQRWLLEWLDNPLKNKEARRRMMADGTLDAWLDNYISKPDVSSDWVRYSQYELRKDDNGIIYVTPAPEATFKVYNPLDVASKLVVDALGIGNMMVSSSPNYKKIERAVLRFAKNYGLLGFMPYLPLNRNYFQRENVYLPKTDITDSEQMKTTDYIALFLPFKKKPIKLDSVLPLRPAEITGRPISYDVVFSNAYSERLDWLTSYFEAFFTHFAATFYHKKTSSERYRGWFEDEIEHFGNDGLGYSITLRNGKPTLLWSFNSLKLAMETTSTAFISPGKAVRFVSAGIAVRCFMLPQPGRSSAKRNAETATTWSNTANDLRGRWKNQLSRA